MGFLAGETITAARLNRLQPKKYFAVGSATLNGPATNADIVDATITLTTETDGAGYIAWAVLDHDLTGATTAIVFGRVNLDGVNLGDTTAFQAEVATDRATAPQQYQGTIATAGSHTFKLVASPPANASVLGVNSTLVVEITEVV